MTININTNVSSLKIRNTLASTTSCMSQLMSRISSGVKIQSAKDNAAGAVISAKMGVQINSNTIVQNNIQSANAMLATTEGNLTTILQNLTRVRDLTLQAKNSTYSPSEILTMQNEIEELIAEIDRVSESATFSSLKLFNDEKLSKEGVVFQVGTNADDDNTIKVESSLFKSVDFKTLTGIKWFNLLSERDLDSLIIDDLTSDDEFHGKLYVHYLADEVKIISEEDRALWEQYKTTDYLDQYFIPININDRYLAGARMESFKLFCESNSYEIPTIKNINSANQYYFSSDENYTDEQLSDLIEEYHKALYLTDDYKILGDAYYDFCVWRKEKYGIDKSEDLFNFGSYDNIVVSDIAVVPKSERKTWEYWRKELASSECLPNISNMRVAHSEIQGFVKFCENNSYILPTMNTDKLVPDENYTQEEITSLLREFYDSPYISDDFEATGRLYKKYLEWKEADGEVPDGYYPSYVDLLDNAIGNITSRLSQIGSLQNRLDSSSELVSNQNVNLNTAKSIIVDTDIAQESSEYVRKSILQQVTTSLLAQANQAPSIALSLV